MIFIIIIKENRKMQKDKIYKVFKRIKNPTIPNSSHLKIVSNCSTLPHNPPTTSFEPSRLQESAVTV